jgi:hypothetical protein
VAWNAHHALRYAAWGTEGAPHAHDFLMSPDKHTASFARDGLDRSGFRKVYMEYFAAGATVHPDALFLDSAQVPAVCNCDRMVALFALKPTHWVRPDAS